MQRKGKVALSCSRRCQFPFVCTQGGAVPSHRDLLLTNKKQITLYHTEKSQAWPSGESAARDYQSKGTSQKCGRDAGQDAILPHNYHCRTTVAVQATVLRYTPVLRARSVSSVQDGSLPIVLTSRPPDWSLVIGLVVGQVDDLTPSIVHGVDVPIPVANRIENDSAPIG